MHIEVMSTLTDAQRSEWRRFQSEAKHSHPEQDPDYAEGFRAQGQDVLFAMGWKDDRLAAVALINIEREALGISRKASAQSGPVCDDARDMRTFLQAVSSHDALRGVAKLTVTPYWLGDEATHLSTTLDNTGWVEFESNDLRKTGLHDLSGGPKAIAARFNKSARRKLRRAQDPSLGLDIVYVADEATAKAALEIQRRQFLAKTGDTMDTSGLLIDFRNIYRKGEVGALFVVRHAGRILAGCIVSRNRDTVFLRNSFVDEAAVAETLGNIRIAPLLTLEALSWGYSRGCLYGDENGYIHGLEPDHPLYDVYKYKEDFRPTEVQRMPGHRIVLRPARATCAELADRVITKARTVALRNLPVGLTVGSSAGLLAVLLVD